jgi:hypothetical protein
MAWQLAAALIATQVASTAISYMGSKQQSRQLRASAAWDRYLADQKKKQELIRANQEATMLMSEKRAAIGARGPSIGTGSTLLETQAVLDELDDTVFWIEKGYSNTLMAQDAELAGALAQESWNRKTTLLKGATSIATTAYTSKADFGFGGSGSSGYSASKYQTGRSVPVSSRTGPAFGGS